MKKLPLVLFSLLFIFSVAGSVNAQIVAADTILPISKLEKPPVIDGKMDTVWTWIPRTMATKIVDATELDDWYDWAVWFKVACDNENFYIYCWAADESLYDDTFPSNPWEDDSYELYFDADYSHGWHNDNAGGYDDLDDIQMRFPWNRGTEGITLGGANTAKFDPLAWEFEQNDLENVSGWEWEASIPLSQLMLDTTPGTIFGFEFDGNEDDDGTTRDGKLKWWGNDDTAWNFPSAFGTAEITSRVAGEYLDVPKAKDNFAIDAQMEDTWKEAAWIPGNFLQDNSWAKFDDWYDSYMQWKLMWDNAGLVYFVEVWDSEYKEDTGQRDWQDDAIELYLDTDNSKTEGTYDGIDDAQVRFVWDAANIVNLQGVGGVVAPSWSADGMNGGIEFAGVETDLGWNLEVRFPFDLIMLDNSIGTEFGIEMDYNDDDDGTAERDHKIKTYTMDDNTWQNASLLGTAVLTAGATEVDDYEPAVIIGYALDQNYPNPFNPTTSISYSVAKTGNVELKIFDLLGKEVSVLVNEVKSAGRYSATFDGADLSSGVYFYTLNTGDQTFTKKMTLMK
ncbi:MAG: T9SS C-terminal target domain-containing protein [Calditrichaeota bacterium]|nr:MAG: T9SS C-terminal target domain-containing protein [Calditrichota bacterium]